MTTDAIYAKARNVRIAIFDVDGILTDGTLYLTDGGEEIKAFSSRDGHGMRLLRESGVELALITGRTSRFVELRAKNLGITHVFQGADDKAQAFAQLLAQLKIEASAAAYMGDDILDLPVLIRAGLSFTVPEAPIAVRSRVDYVTQAGGGKGAAREVCELIMQAQGTLEARIQAYLK